MDGPEVPRDGWSPVTTNEKAVLLAAQEKAIHLLTEARERAESYRQSEADDALALLLRHQSEAEDLLAHPQEDPLPALTRAEALLRGQEIDAAELRNEVEQRAVEILLQAQREAAAILLEARLTVEAGRSAKVTP